MEKPQLLTVQQLYDYACNHNMAHARLQFEDGCYYDIVDAKISSSILYPGQQFIVLS